MNANGFAVFDADSHVLEPRAIWDTYLDPDYHIPARSALWREENEFGGYIKLNGRPIRDDASEIPEAIWRPGMTLEQIGDMDPATPIPANPGASDPEARLRDMDAMGVDQTLLFPTLFAEYFPLVEDPDVAYALARAYNDWLADFCAAAPARLYAAGVVPLQNMAFAVAELRRLSTNPCFKAVFVRPMLVEDRYLNHPYYEPLWIEAEKLGITVAVHPTAGLHNPEGTSHGQWIEKVKSRLTDRANSVGLSMGSRPDHALPSDGLGAWRGPGLGHPAAEALAPWLDNMMAVMAMFFYGVLERHPSLKMVFAHGKATWIPLALEKVETYVLTLLPTHGLPITSDPEGLWEQHPAMLGFDADELGIQRLPEDYEEKVVWGSRYPHYDTMSARDAIQMLTQAGVSRQAVARMLGGNGATIYGVELREAARKQVPA
jgi:predicted TIM-barrel fold metal-dependent hydrolase